MTDLEDAIREALIQEEGLTVAEADKLVPILVDVALAMKAILPADQMLMSERAELEHLRRRVGLDEATVKAKQQAIDDLTIQLADMKAQRDRLRGTIKRIGMFMVDAEVVSHKCEHDIPWVQMTPDHWAMRHGNDRVQQVYPMDPDWHE